MIHLRFYEQYFCLEVRGDMFIVFLYVHGRRHGTCAAGWVLLAKAVVWSNATLPRTFFASFMGGSYVGMACLLSIVIGGNLFNNYIAQCRGLIYKPIDNSLFFWAVLFCRCPLCVISHGMHFQTHVHLAEFHTATMPSCGCTTKITKTVFDWKKQSTSFQFFFPLLTYWDLTAAKMIKQNVAYLTVAAKGWRSLRPFFRWTCCWFCSPVASSLPETLRPWRLARWRRKWQSRRAGGNCLWCFRVKPFWVLLKEMR